MQRTLPSPFRTIIAQAEFRHQRYVIESSRSSRGWILLAVLLLAPGLLMSLVAFGFALFGIDPADVIAGPSSLGNDLLSMLGTAGMVSLVTMNFALYPVVLLITLGLSANSITREKTAHTWELLLLTNIDSRQLVWGKWWASLRALWGDHMMLAILRIGWVALLIAQAGDALPDGALGIPARLEHLMVWTLLLVAYTTLDAAFTAALGVAVPLSNLPNTLTGAIVLGVRVFGVVFNVMWLALTIFAFVFSVSYVLTGAVGVLIGVIMTWLALRAAQTIAVRGQVSRPV